MNTERCGVGVSHSLSMRGAEIALKTTSCRLRVVMRSAAFRLRLDGASITLLHVLLSVISGLVGHYMQLLFINYTGYANNDATAACTPPPQHTHTLPPPPPDSILTLCRKLDMKLCRKKKNSKASKFTAGSGRWWYRWLRS